MAVPAWLVLALASSTYASDAVESTSRREIAATFEEYDFDSRQLDGKECRDDMEHALCPSAEEEHIPCSGLDVVEKYCRRILGEELVLSSGGGAAEGRGRNALEGCMNYVSWDDDSLNCCPSDHCFEVTGEGEWGEWELVDEDEVEDEDFEYEYTDVLYEEDGGGIFDDEYVEFYEDDVEYYEDEEDGDGDEDRLYSENDSEDDDEANGTHEDNLHHADDGESRRPDDSLRQIPFVHVPPAST